MTTQPLPAASARGAAAWPITFDEVLAARQRLRPFLSPTPLRNYRDTLAVDTTIARAQWLWCLNRGFLFPAGAAAN